MRCRPKSKHLGALTVVIAVASAALDVEVTMLATRGFDPSHGGIHAFVLTRF
jgi:hypothetical protein